MIVFPSSFSLSSLARRGLLVALIVFIADQTSKYFLLYGMDLRFDPRVIEIAPFFNLVMVWNHGVSFGIFNNGPSSLNALLLSLFAMVMVAILLVWLSRAHSRLLAGALGLVIGGALGNVLDRVLYGAVADFFDFHAYGFHYPAFNIADSAIVVGAFLILYDGLFRSKSSS